MVLLPLDRFYTVVRDTVLVAIDLIIFNEEGHVLVGRRQNRPAKGYLFVPGGRIMKGETLDQALVRISTGEVGITLNKNQVKLYGIYDHIYDDNYFEDVSFNTQYIILACSARLSIPAILSGDDQHDCLISLTIPDLLARPDVHIHTKNYFMGDCQSLFF